MTTPNSDFRSCQPTPRITIRDGWILTFFPNVMSPTRAFSGSSWMDCCSEALMLSSSSSVLLNTCVQANGHVSTCVHALRHMAVVNMRVSECGLTQTR